jgi:drug/metabolite transporter (DMT)-like permease
MNHFPISSAALIVVLGGVGVLGDVCIKRAADSSQVDLRYFAAGATIYLVTATGWLLVMRSVKLITIGPLYAISTILLLTIAGMVLGERIRPAEILGICLAVASVALLARFGGA